MLERAWRPTTGGPSAEDIAKHVWGAMGVLIFGKDWDRLALLPSAPPYWAKMTQQRWLLQHDGEPVRLLLSCRFRGYHWELPSGVHVTPVRTGTGT